MSELLKAKQAGARIGLSARSVYALAKAGKLACYRVGEKDSAVRFAPEDLDAYLTSCRSPATTRAAGSTNLIASSPERASGLTAYFRKAGREPKRKPSTSAKRQGSTSLQLVATSGMTIACRALGAAVTGGYGDESRYCALVLA